MEMKNSSNEGPRPLPVIHNSQGLYPGTNVQFIKPVNAGALDCDELSAITSVKISTRDGRYLGFTNEGLHALLTGHHNEPTCRHVLEQRECLDHDKHARGRLVTGEVRVLGNIYQIYEHDGLCQLWEIEVLPV